MMISRDDPVAVSLAPGCARRVATAQSDSCRVTLKLPSERALADEYEVACTTVRHAMQILRERGLIVTIHGRGTFVAASLP